MAQTWNDLLAFLRDHGDVLSAGLALVILAEAAAIFLWARRAAALGARAEENLEVAERAQLEVARLQGELARLEETTTRQPVGRGLYRVRGLEGETTPAASPAAMAPAETPPAAAPASAPAPAPSLPAAMPPPPTPAPLVPVAGPSSAPAADPAAESRPRELVFPDDEVASSPSALRAASWATSMESATALTNGAPTGWGQMPAAEVTAPATPEAAPPPAATAWPPPTPAPGDASPASDNGDASTDDVLLVEDDDNVARLYRTLLEGRGFTLRHAEDGVAGLEEVHRRRPGLILLDMMMPRMNGITFLQSMREEPEYADVPVVVLSNFREERLVERATALGALEYLVKAQTRPSALVDAIPHWMRGLKVG